MAASDVLIISLLCCLCAANKELSGCTNSSPDDLTNRLTKRAGLKAIEALLEESKPLIASRETPKEGACPRLTFSSLNINIDRFEHHAQLVSRNGKILSDSLSSLKSASVGGPMTPIRNPVTPNHVLVLFSKVCGAEGNPFYQGGPIVGSLTLSTLDSSTEIFASGACLGFFNATLSTCNYRYRVPPKYSLSFASFGVWSESWIRLPREQVTRVNNTLAAGGNLAEHAVTRQMRTLGTRIVNTLEFGYSRTLWTDPYFDCFLGFIWMITYSTPIVRIDDNNEPVFAGMTAVDINLSDIDINECERGPSDTVSAFDSFRNTHLCEAASTQCRAVRRGFNFGSYQCHCRDGYYRTMANGSDLPLAEQYFSGLDIENATLQIRNQSSCGCTDPARCALDTERVRRVLLADFACLRCPPGCDRCTTGREVCTVQPTTALVVALSLLGIIAVAMCVALVAVVVVHRETRVIRSASWPFLVVTLAGAVMALIGVTLDAFAGSFTDLRISGVICVVAPWLHYLGFAMTYGSILVKTWRLHQIFSTRRFRGKGRSRLRNTDLAYMLLAIIAGFIVLLLFWTLGLRPVPETRTTSSGLKYERCSMSFVDNVMIAITLIFLCPVVYLSFQLRNITDDFSETKEIHLSVYIFFVVKVISLVAENIVSFTPSLHYLVRALDVHFSFTLVVVIFFMRKINKLAAGSGDDTPQNAFILNKKKSPANEKANSTISLDDAHRRSAGSLENTANRKSLANIPASSLDAAMDGSGKNYLPSLTEEKNGLPSVKVDCGGADSETGSIDQMQKAGTHRLIENRSSMSLSLGVSDPRDPRATHLPSIATLDSDVNTEVDMDTNPVADDVPSDSGAYTTNV